MTMPTAKASYRCRDRLLTGQILHCKGYLEHNDIKKNGGPEPVEGQLACAKSFDRLRTNGG
jgi:hypothetical protein